MNQAELKKQIEAMIEERCLALGVDPDDDLDVEHIILDIQVRPEGGYNPRHLRAVWSRVPTSKT